MKKYYEIDIDIEKENTKKINERNNTLSSNLSNNSKSNLITNSSNLFYNKENLSSTKSKKNE